MLLQDGDGYITAAEIQELLGSDKCAQGIRGFGIVHRPGSTYYEGSSSSELHAYSISKWASYDKCTPIFFEFADIKDLVAKADTDGDGKVSFGGKINHQHIIIYLYRSPNTIYETVRKWRQRGLKCFQFCHGPVCSTFSYEHEKLSLYKKQEKTKEFYQVVDELL